MVQCNSFFQNENYNYCSTFFGSKQFWECFYYNNNIIHLYVIFFHKSPCSISLAISNCQYICYCVSTTFLTLSIAVVHESVSLVVSRQILTELCNHIPNMESSTAKEVSHFVLDKLQPRAISFEEQVSADGKQSSFLCISFMGRRENAMVRALAFHHYGPGLILILVEFVVVSYLAPRVFHRFLQFFFLSPLKPASPNFTSTKRTRMNPLINNNG